MSEFIVIFVTIVVLGWVEGLLGVAAGKKRWLYLVLRVTLLPADKKPIGCNLEVAAA